MSIENMGDKKVLEMAKMEAGLVSNMEAIQEVIIRHDKIVTANRHLHVKLSDMENRAIRAENTLEHKDSVDLHAFTDFLIESYLKEQRG